MMNSFATRILLGSLLAALCLPLGWSDPIAGWVRPREVAGAREVSRRAEMEAAAFDAALLNLEFYMQSIADQNIRRGAQLLSSFEVNAKRASDDTRRLYREHGDLFSGYVSVSSDVYGYEFSVDRFGASVLFEGGVETTSGFAAEFEACMVFRDNRWLIWSLEID